MPDDLLSEEPLEGMTEVMPWLLLGTAFAGGVVLTAGWVGVTAWKVTHNVESLTWFMNGVSSPEWLRGIRDLLVRS